MSTVVLGAQRAFDATYEGSTYLCGYMFSYMFTDVARRLLNLSNSQYPANRGTP
jgi:hypothetical protein